VCEFGGITHLWAVRYDSGGALKKGVLRGKALIQVSTGSIEEKDLSTAFSEKRDAGAEADKTVKFRRTAPIPGLASTEKPQINIPPKPMRTILHIRER
jgi:type IV pilus assembly protein PilY1